MIDLRYFIIPDVISLPGIVLGIVFSFLRPEMQGQSEPLMGLLYSSLSALGCGGILMAVAVFGTLLFKKEAMGMGDIKLVALFGAFIGFKNTLLTIFLSSIIGSIAGIALIFFSKAKMKTRIPYGPYLAIGALIALFYGEQIIDWYMRLVVGGGGI